MTLSDYSIPLFTIVIVLAVVISCLHLLILCRLKASSLKPRYITAFSLCFILSLFVPIIVSDPKVGNTYLYESYLILLNLQYYARSSRDWVIDSLVVGLPIIQHILCFGAALFFTNWPNKTLHPTAHRG
jgi:hypothetical protein